MIELRPYADKMNAVLRNLAKGAEIGMHPLLAVRPRKTIEVLVITSDRGLCGAFNSNIQRAMTGHVAELRKEGFQLLPSAIGKKAVDHFRRRNIPLKRSWAGISGRVTYLNAQEVAKGIIEDYTNEVMDEVFIVYNEFKTVISQKVTMMKLLPLAPTETEGIVEPARDFIYEPSQEEIYNVLLPKNVEIQIYRALLESQASEEAARMTAMENATKNANEMIDKLTLQYNKARQASITKELMDIVGGVEALK